MKQKILLCIMLFISSIACDDMDSITGFDYSDVRLYPSHESENNDVILTMSLEFINAESIEIGTGFIYLYESKSDVFVQRYNITSEVEFDSAKKTISFKTPILCPEKEYYVLIEPGVILVDGKNDFEMLNANDWVFKTYKYKKNVLSCSVGEPFNFNFIADSISDSIQSEKCWKWVRGQVKRDGEIITLYVPFSMYSLTTTDSIENTKVVGLGGLITGSGDEFLNSRWEKLKVVSYSFNHVEMNFTMKSYNENKTDSIELKNAYLYYQFKEAIIQ